MNTSQQVFTMVTLYLKWSMVTAMADALKNVFLVYLLICLTDWSYRMEKHLVQEKSVFWGRPKKLGPNSRI